MDPRPQFTERWLQYLVPYQCLLVYRKTNQCTCSLGVSYACREQGPSGVIDHVAVYFFIFLNLLFRLEANCPAFQELKEKEEFFLESGELMKLVGVLLG